MPRHVSASTSPQRAAHQWRVILPGQHGYIWVTDDEKNSQQRIDLRSAGAYIGCLPHWLNVLEKGVKLCVWVKDWQSAPPFQYLFDLMDYDKEGFLPNWHIFCEDDANLPNMLKWRKPSTSWNNWPVIAMVAETDFLDNDLHTRPNSVGGAIFLQCGLYLLQHTETTARISPLGYLSTTGTRTPGKLKYVNHRHQLSASKRPQ